MIINNDIAKGKPPEERTANNILLSEAKGSLEKVGII
jgi:hypothetical protein